MKKSIKQDERVVSEKRKIGSDACQLLMVYLIGSVLVQQYVFQAPFKAYAVEFVGFFGASLYIVIRALMRGHEVVPKKNATKTAVINSLVTGVTIALVTVFLNSGNATTVSEKGGALAMSIGISFVVATGASFVLYMGMNWWSRKRQKALEQECDQE
ncbi:MAG: DUF6773 family protein [Niameybacter sp.]|uniref:DUF6773 family protein n=1 Tax=Niameybacter sp. TaxID=2033640 RepID=UPI002FCAC2F1